jgi:hypothetical protein
MKALIIDNQGNKSAHFQQDDTFCNTNLALRHEISRMEAAIY